MSRERYLPQDPQSLIRAKELRKNSTKEENHIWYDCLKKMPCHFYRQYVIERYIVDFFCPKADIVIEIDGSQHFDDSALEYDRRRTETLNRYGLLVLRYTNHQIHTEFDAVGDDIYNHVVQRTKSLP